MDDKNIYNDENEIDINRSETQNSEESAYVENDTNSLGGEEEAHDKSKSESENQEKADEHKEAHSCEEGEADACKNQASEEQVRSDSVNQSSAEYVWNADRSRENNTQSSSWGNSSSTYHFKPENMREYVGRPNGYHYSAQGSDQYSANTYSQEPYEQGDPNAKTGKNKKRKGRGKKALIIALVALLTALALVAGGAIGYFAAYNEEPSITDDEDTVAHEDETGGEISMVKNDSPIDVRIEPGTTGYTNLTRSEVIELVADAVVEITTSTVQTNSFFGGNYVTSGAGSGVVIAQNESYAYVATNYHVIDGASSVTVTLTDKTSVDAEYLDGDSSFDIALLRIKTDKTFPKIVCGSSDSLKVGDDVIAIGNPLGRLGGTVTEGIVSALDRQITIDSITMNLIQTSAAVNPGNSGGGLFNMAGELVGIVNAKQSAEGIEGLGFAIPIDDIYEMLVEIIETKYIHGRATIGIEVEYVSDVWEAISKYRLNTTGVFITSSSNDSLKARDLIRSINGQLITDKSSYVAAISELEIGQTITVEVYRNGKLTEVSVEVTEYVPAGIFG